MKDNKKHNLLRVFSNVLMMLKYLAKFTPGLLAYTIFNSILSGTVGVLDTIYLAKYVLEGLQNNKNFYSMLPTLLIILGANLLLALLNGLYNGSYFPRKKQYLYGKMHEELFAHAKEMELACYDNPKFYNDFVWAMSEADERAISVLEMTGSFLRALTISSESLTIVAGVNQLGIIIVAGSLLLEGLISLRINRLQYECNSKQKPLQRKRDYTSRILYQPEYAKEIRLSHVKNILIDNFCTSNEKLIGEIKKYGRKIFILDLLQFGILKYALINGIYMGILLKQTLTYHAYTYGSLYAVLTGIITFSDNWSEMVYLFARIQKDSLYIERFRTFMEYVPKQKDCSDPLPTPAASKQISLENVTFSYDGTKSPTLKNINLTINPGEKLAVVGFNGAGKTTLIKLIMRLYDPDSGTIKLGNTDIRRFKISKLREYFGVVFQDYKILAARIDENVLMRPVEDKDKDAVDYAIKMSGFMEKCNSLPLGTDTMISREFDENGVLLSGGESQKLAISRVFPKNCHVVILDEPSSSLDPISEYNVNQSMLNAAKDKTVIFISHRLSTTRSADRIILLKDGEIAEEGSHEELMQLSGYYSEMFNIQAEKYSKS